MQITIIIYIADIASNKWGILQLMTKNLNWRVTNFLLFIFLLHLIARIRGSLGSISHLARNIGILTIFIFGWASVPYHIVPCIFIAIPIVFAIWFTFIPNTPQYHFSKGNIQVSFLRFPTHLDFKVNLCILTNFIESRMCIVLLQKC